MEYRTTDLSNARVYETRLPALACDIVLLTLLFYELRGDIGNTSKASWNSFHAWNWKAQNVIFSCLLCGKKEFFLSPQIISRFATFVTKTFFDPRITSSQMIIVNSTWNITYKQDTCHINTSL